MKTCALWLFLCLSTAVAQDASKPNVLFIAIDDLNDWVGCLQGHPQVQTPNIDRLAARGTLFTNAHCQSPLCNASRTSLMLGLRPSTTGIYGLAPWFRKVPELKDRVTLAQHFEANGYQTFSGGKIYHGGKGGKQGEFQQWGPNASVGAKPKQKLVNEPSGHPLVDWGTFPHRDEDKGDWHVASWAVEQLDQLGKLDHPFFMGVGFFLPHVPCFATQKWFDLYPDDELQLPAYLDGDRNDVSKFASYLHWDLPETRLSWLKQNNEWRSLVRAYLASTSFVDSQVGRVLDALEASGKADNTIVVLWSDHGWHVGEKDITGKNTLWRASTRVPLIFAGPGVGSGKSTRQPAELLDMYPTLIDLCGLPKRDDLEGHSLLPQLNDPNAKREHPAITTHNHDNHSVVTDQWRFIRYADGSEELYDIVNDPNEWANVAKKGENAEVRATLTNFLPKTNLKPAPGSASRILTYIDGDLVWEGKEIDPKQKVMPGEVPISKAGTRIFAHGNKAVEVLTAGAGEGPAWHPQLGLLVSGDGHIQQLKPDGQLGVFKKDVGSNGLLFDHQGDLLVCSPKNCSVMRIRQNGNVDILTEGYEGKRYNAPNDLALDSKGRLYFTDPQYGNRDKMEQFDANQKAVEGVYRIDTNGKVTRIITHEVDRPNGILVSPDNDYLYVADNNNNTAGGARILWRFDLNDDGSIDPDSRVRLFDWASTRGPDGMAQDSSGRLYIAAGLHKAKPPHEINEQPTSGVYVLNPDGALLDFVAIPNDEVTNCAFGGPDWKTLYITAGGHLWSIRTESSGVVPLTEAKDSDPNFLYSLHFNAPGENRYPAKGAYKQILEHLDDDFQLRVHDDQLTTDNLADVDVVLISNPSAKAFKDNPAPPLFSPNAIATLREYVYNGGGLIIMGNQENHNLETETTNQLLGHFGMRWVDRYTDAKPLKIAGNTPVLGGLIWAYYTGNLIELAPAEHPAMPRALVMNDLTQKPVKGPRDEEGCLLGIAEPGKGRVVVVTDSGWIINTVFNGKGIGGVAIENHDNAEIFRRLATWAANTTR